MTSDRTGDAPRVVCFGEVLLRLAAPVPQLLFQDMALVPSFCGAEANVAVNLAGLGHRCRLATALPANPVGDAASRTIAQFGVDVTAQMNPGSRMGIYFLEPGAMGRPRLGWPATPRRARGRARRSTARPLRCPAAIRPEHIVHFRT